MADTLTIGLYASKGKAKGLLVFRVCQAYPLGS
jgi:hypothetical protein